MKIVIVGGGIMGAALARSLSEAGADVCVLESGGGATPASFGWVNASFYTGEAHFHLRAEGIAAWKRLGGAVTWTGCLCWDESGADFDAKRDELISFGYEVEEVDAARFAALEPHVAPPPRALRLVQEGVAEPARACARLIAGVRRISGPRALGIATDAGRVTGVETTHGTLPADRVIVAAGTGSPALLESVGVSLPMLDRPGLMLRTAPLPPIFGHVLAAPAQEVRQDSGGHIWAPTVANHQGDDTSEVTVRPDLLADAAIARLKALLPGQRLVWDRVTLAMRPVPQDGLPVIGAAGPEGLFVSVMHSGITLAAVAAELLTPQVLGAPLSNAQAALVAPFTPDRFQSG